jgi:hypothetical protein
MCLAFATGLFLNQKRSRNWKRPRMVVWCLFTLQNVHYLSSKRLLCRGILTIFGTMGMEYAVVPLNYEESLNNIYELIHPPLCNYSN